MVMGDSRPEGTCSNSGSTGTDKTAERVFPASTLVKSPAYTNVNPFSKLSGLRRPYEPSASSPGGSNSQADSQTGEHAEGHQPAKSGTTTQPSTAPMEEFEQPLTTRFEQLDRVKDNAGTTEVDDASSTFPHERDADGQLYTQRFQYTTAKDGSYKIYTGIGTQGVQSCEDEPIHTPGAVQRFGVLITLRELSPKVFQVCHVSENSTEILGLSPLYLFRLQSFSDVLFESDQELLFDQLDFLHDSNSSDITINQETTSSIDVDANVSPEVFVLSGRREASDEAPWKCWVALHSSLVNPGLVVLEFELYKDNIYPLMLNKGPTESPSTSRPAGTPERGLSAQEKAGMDGEGFGAFSEEDLLESTTSASKPLRRVRKSMLEGDESGTMEIFSILSQVNEQLSAADNLQSFVKIVVGLIKEICRFHRVMLYQFDERWNGQVVAELVDWNETKDLFQGLCFPASDIPAQARALYVINKVRVLYDRDLPTARLVCRDQSVMQTPLDMTHCFLRAMSPIHCKYLANMGVRASMSVSITAFGQLWGLIACHSYGQTSMRCSFLVRKLVRLMGEQISHNIERLSYAARLTSRKLIQMPNDRNPSGYIVSKAEDLLGLFDADIGMLSIGDEGKLLGPMENSQEAIALREYFRQKRFATITPSSNLAADFPDLCYEPGFKTIAGVLYVPLNRSGQDFLLFFRRGQLKQVHWAGNPYEKVVEKNRGKASVLLPRQSFKVWSESVVGRCKEWSEDQVETAAILCLVYGRFIDVWREKQQALQTSKLATLLLNNAGHEVRTPLNAVINYIEIALEGNLDEATRENLQKSHTASKSLIYVINDLLDLTKSEQGQELFRTEPFDIFSTIREAVSMYRSQATKAEVSFVLKEDPNIPRRVIGDQAKIRQVVGNVTANALKYTARGSVTVETKLLSKSEASCEMAIIIQDTGSGISEDRLDAIFSNFELIEAPPKPDSVGGEKELGTGLGLAIVARVVRNMNGQLKAKSKIGQGSVFTFIFDFALPQEEIRRNSSSTVSATASTSTKKMSSRPSTEMPKGQMTSKRSTAQGILAGGPRRGTSVCSDSTDFDKNPVTGELSWPSAGQHAVSRVGSAADRQGAGRTKSSVKAAEAAVKQSMSSDGSVIDQLVKSMLASSTGSSVHVNASIRDSETAAQSSLNDSVHGEVDGNTVLPSSIETSPTKRSAQGQPDHHRGAHSYEQQPDIFDDHNEPQTRTVASSYSQPIVRAVKMEQSNVPVPRAYTKRVPELRSQTTNKGSSQMVKPTGSAPGIKPLSILVAEDDAVNRSIIQKRLQIDKHSVTLANDGSLCYDEYVANPDKYDVILMDMQMPVLDGMEASRQIRALEAKSSRQKKRRTPIIAVSASLLESQAQEAIDCGIDGWILKPVDFTRLREFLTSLSNRESRNKAIYAVGGDQKWEAGGWLTRSE